MSNEYLGLYLEEALALWSEGEQALRASRHDAFLRVAHTLKGMSATMGYRGLAQVFHDLDSAAQQGKLGTESISRWVSIGSTLDEAAATRSDRPLHAFQAPLKRGGEPAANAAPDPLPMAGPWVLLRVQRHEPMPRARVMQWIGELRRLGFSAWSPGEDEIARATTTDRLWVRIDRQEQIGELRRLTGVAAIESSEGPGTTGDGKAAELLRVDLQQLDPLFDDIGQLHVHLSVLGNLAVGTATWERELREVRSLATRSAQRVAGIRLTSIRALMDVFEQSARATADQLGKAVVVERSGADIRVAREIVERLRPLIPHIARNAVAHGIETVELRRRRGKPDPGTLRFAAEQIGPRVRLTIRDDGGGVDLDALRRKPGAAGLGEEELLELLFSPGMTTRTEADDFAGRGVGLDAVRSAVEAAGGWVAARHQPQRGFELVIELPVPLSIAPVREVMLGDVPVGIVDRGWVEQQFADENVSVEVPGLPTDGPIVLVCGGNALRVRGHRALGHVYVHSLRAPLDELDGALGFYLGDGGAPRLLMDVRPRGAPADRAPRGGGVPLWQGAVAAMGGLAKATARVSAWRAVGGPVIGTGWCISGRPLGDIQLFFPRVSRDDVRAWLARCGYDSRDGSDDEWANWLLTRALELSGVDAQSLLEAGPPRIIHEFRSAPPSARPTGVAVEFEHGLRAWVTWWRP